VQTILGFAVLIRASRRRLASLVPGAWHAEPPGASHTGQWCPGWLSLANTVCNRNATDQHETGTDLVTLDLERP